MNSEMKLTKNEMKSLGYQAVDMVVEHFENMDAKSVTRCASKKEMEALFDEVLPQAPSDPKLLLKQLDQDVFTNIMHLDHPRFFGFVSSPSNYMSVLADFLSSGFNVFSGTWLEAAAPTQIELTTIDWLAELFSFPKSSRGGLFVSGGSKANLTAMCLAKSQYDHSCKDLVVYGSDQTHSSVEKAIRIIGAGRVIFKRVETSAYEIDIAKLEKQVEEDLAAGLQPICIVGNAGTTNTGSVDDLNHIAVVCKKYKLWFHVDGAYGGVAYFSQSEKSKFEGIEKANSVSIDPHKWFFQPYEIGCLLVRDKNKLNETFNAMPEYLNDIQGDEAEVNFCNQGIQLTRSFRSLKLWLSLKTFGFKSFVAAIEHGIELAKYAEKLLQKDDQWEVLSGAKLGIVCFRFKPLSCSEEQLNQINQKIIDDLVATGFAMISSTILSGKVAIRLCIINPRCQKSDIQKTINLLSDIRNGCIYDD